MNLLSQRSSGPLRLGAWYHNLSSLGAAVALWAGAVVTLGAPIALWTTATAAGDAEPLVTPAMAATAGQFLRSARAQALS
jgi:hypothetical protein